MGSPLFQMVCGLRFGTQQRVYGTLPGAYAAFSLVTRGPPLSNIGVTSSSPLYACPPEAFQIGDELWDRFNGGRQGTIWYYRELSEIFQRLLPCPLADGLSRTVSGFPSIRLLCSGA